MCDQVDVLQHVEKTKNEDWGVKLPQHRRPDGRQHDFHLRPPACQLQPLKNAHGSARFQMGRTNVLAAVYGPRQASYLQGARCAVATDVGQGVVQVFVRPAGGPITVMHKYLESCLSSVLARAVQLDRLMYTTLTVIVLPETDDGGLVSCAINAAMSALLDAGIPMTSTYLAVSFLQKQSMLSASGNPQIIFDPTFEEASLASREVDVSIYHSCTLDIHNESLVQLTPEYNRTASFMLGPNGTQFCSTDFQTNAPTVWLNQWMSFLHTLTAVGGACRLLGSVVRLAVQQRLTSLVTTTFKANNQMELPEENDA